MKNPDILHRKPLLVLAAITCLSVLTACDADPANTDPAEEMTIVESAPTSDDAGGNDDGEAPEEDAQPACSLANTPAGSWMAPGTATPVADPEEPQGQIGTFIMGNLEDEYSCSGLSWAISRDGEVPMLSGDPMPNGGGSALVFFVDGEQVTDPVMVSRITSVYRVTDEIVSVTYDIGGGEYLSPKIFRFYLNDGELTVDDPDDTRGFVWTLPKLSEMNPDVDPAAFSTEDDDDTNDSTADGRLSQQYLSNIHYKREFFSSANRVFEMTTEDDIVIRCGFEDHYQWLCASSEPYWDYADSDDAVDMKNGTAFSGPDELVTQLWEDDAEIIDLGRTASMPPAATTGAEYGWVHFDGTNIVRGGISGSNGTSAIVMSPSERYIIDI